jgi:multicomponent Na+:H+ antiporter subunit F
MNVFEWTVVGLLMIAVVLATVRILFADSLGDRAVAFDVASSIITTSVLGWVVVGGGQTYLLDVALALSLIGFLTVVTVARYIERRGS